MECVLDTTNPEDSEGAPKNSQQTYEWRPPTRDFGGLERRLGRMEENVASIYETLKTVVDLLHNQRVGNETVLNKPDIPPARRISVLNSLLGVWISR